MNEYVSVDPGVSMFPAPADGTPSDTTSPNAYPNDSSTVKFVEKLYVPTSSPRPSTTNVYVPDSGNTNGPRSKNPDESNTTALDGAVTDQSANVADPANASKYTDCPAVPVNEYVSVDPCVSMFPAPADGTPSDTTSPNAYPNDSSTVKFVEKL